MKDIGLASDAMAADEDMIICCRPRLADLNVDASPVAESMWLAYTFNTAQWQSQ